MLFCLVIVFSCDNRKVCIEADDFGFEDIERFDVQSFLSPQNAEDDCSYRQEADGFSSSNTDLHYCLNGVTSGQDHCAESYDGYVAYTETIGTTSVTKYCRFINNDINDATNNELTSGEVSCVSPSNTLFVNKGCNIGSTNIVPGQLFFSTSSTSWSQSGSNFSLPAIAEIKANCVSSCVERCRKKKACSHIASRQPIKSVSTTDVDDSTTGAEGTAYAAFNPYSGTFLLKHILDGNLFVISGLSLETAAAGDVDNYKFTWIDSSSELRQMFRQLRKAENKKKLSLAIKEVISGGTPSDGKSILINDFDGCSIDSNDVFTCVINKNRDLATKDKFSRFFSTPPTSRSALLVNVISVAIFDYVKIGSSAININDRTITTQKQHHFGTNSIVEIVSSVPQYKIKVKKILDNKHFIYEEIAGQTISINEVINSCSTPVVNCFLIPSIENVDWQDKFMPSWKATTSKSSATATGGLQISAGSKVEIEATGQITLGSSEEKVCHKNITSYNPNLYEDVGGSCGSASKIFNFAANTKYQPNVKIIFIPSADQTKYTLYRSLTTTEKSNITHNDSNYNDLCKSFCYIKITATTPPTVADFACDASLPEIESGTSTDCQYSGSAITTQYDSAKEQVRIANYAKKVIIDSSATSDEGVNVGSYTPPTTLIKPFIDDDTEKTYAYDDLKISMDISSYELPLLVYFDNLSSDCRIKPTIGNIASTTNAVFYQDLHFIFNPNDVTNVITSTSTNNVSIVYPGTTLYLKKITGDCSALTITPYPYIEFTASQSGFVQFKSTNASCTLKKLRVVNNTDYPGKKFQRTGVDENWSVAYNNSYQHNIVPGNRFVDVLLNKIANKIFNIYQSFAALPVATIPSAGIYNQQGVNDNFQACNACFATAITKTVVANTCGAVPSSGCGGLKSAITYDANGVLTATPQNGNPGKITITFLDGEELVYSNPGVYHLSVDADRKITKIEAIGGGGGASYDFESSTANNGGHAQILKIEAPSGGVNIISGIDNDYKTENRYTLKIMVGHGGKNSTEINDYRTFSQISHRDSYDYNFYKKDFGYAGGAGESSVVGFVHNTANKIKTLVVAGGGGGGAGRTCNDSVGSFIGSASLKPNQHLLQNATYEYLRNVVECRAGESFLQNVIISKLNCDSILSGAPGFCGTGTCSIVGANIDLGQSTESATVNHGGAIYCITGYTETRTSPSVALTANCAIASGSGIIVGGSCVANSCNAVLIGTAGAGNTRSVPNAISTGNLIPSNQPTSQSLMVSLSCGTGYSIVWSGNGINKATCTSPGTTDITVGSCVANACNAILTSTTGFFGTGHTTSVSNAISTGTTFSSATTIAGLSCGAGYNLSWGSGTAVCTGSDIPVGNCTKNCLASALVNANHGGTTSYVNGNTATCNTGYSQTGTQTITCRNDGTWNGACNANVCINNPAALTGYTPPATLTHNTSKSCDNGYTGTVTLSCLTNGQAATTSGTCSPNVCNSVNSSIAGYSSKTGSFTHNTSTSCDIVYTGTVTLSCLTNGGEATTSGTCAINTCTAPTAPAGYIVPSSSVFSYNYTTTATAITGASCNNANGYSGTANISYTCNNTSSTNSPIPAVIIDGGYSGCSLQQCSIASGTGYTAKTVSYGSSSFACDASNYNGTITYNCPISGIATITGSCNQNCTINSTIIANWGFYKLTPGTRSLSLTHSTTPSSATGISCNTGYNGTAQYTCNNGTLALSGCTANVCTIANASGNKTHNTQVSCATNYGIVDRQTVYAYCSTNNGTGALRTAQNGGGSAVSCKPINGAYYDYNIPDKDHTYYNCVDGDYAIAYVYLNYQTSEGDFSGQHSCARTFTVWKARGEVSVFDENNIQDQEITYCLKGYTAAGRGAGQCM